MSTAVYLVSPLPGEYRAYELPDPRQVLMFAERPWGEPVSNDWITPELVPTAASAGKPDPDFAAFHAGVVVATERAAHAIAFPELELVPVQVDGTRRFLLNPRITLRRYRPENADVVRTPGGAILLMNRTDFFAEDVPTTPACFWFRDKRFPRLLLCNEGFSEAVEGAGLSGLSLKRLGAAY